MLLFFFLLFKPSKNIEKKNVSLCSEAARRPHHHIKMISEGSCDTEDWSKDAENSALPSHE